MFANFIKSIGSRRKQASAGGQDAYYRSTNPIQQSILGYQFGSFDNNYASITRIAERFATVLPYAVGADGEILQDQPIIAALYHPNNQMGSVRFLKTLITLLLVHPSVQLLCWRRQGRRVFPGGDITATNIAGFTFLEGAHKDASDHHLWHVGTQTYGDHEVISLSLDVDPYSVLNGYSPSLAAKKWSTVDDYIKEYEAGLFKNGAVPAGQMIVTAPTKEAFDDIVDELEKHHKGAGKNNNVVYTHRPVNELGEAVASQIEWVPFGVVNKELQLKEIFEQSEKSRDMIFGVPAEVKGYLQNSNYASAATAERVFDKYVVLPKLIQVWSDFTHEMNRVTGGLGCALTFDFDMTVMVDEEKVMAETKKIQLDMLVQAVGSGFTVENVVAALGLPEEFLELGESSTPGGNLPESENPDGEIPDQAATTQKMAKKSLGDAYESDEELEEAARTAMREQIDAAVEEEDYKANAKRDEALQDALMTAVVAIMMSRGSVQFAQGTLQAEMLGLMDENTAGLMRYSVSKAVRSAYREYLSKVATSYNTDTAESIHKVLERGVFEQWDKERLATELRGIMDTDEWRVQRLARTENHRASGQGSLDAMKQLSDQAGVRITKTFHLNPFTINHCEECEALDGQTYELGAVISNHHDNGFVDQETADVHPNCGCYLTFNIESAAKSVKVLCPSCNRYMFGSMGGIMKNVICANSKCKKRYDIEVRAGKIKATEVKNDGNHNQ